ncbi:MAG: carbon-nitrogen hydrolase family protein [Lachnospiraceae bacterium]|nr:carbon-nitrogen hydrolase family protein [Lachnospiraceae bacterium]
MEYMVAAAQMGPNSEDVMVNAKRICDMMAKAADQGADIVAFPEMSLSVYYCVDYMRDYYKYHISDDHLAIKMIREKAKELGINVAFGYAEEADKIYYNSALLIDRKGKVAGKYRKVHIPSPMVSEHAANFEKNYFAAGNLGFPVVEVDGVKIGMQICYDRHMPEGYRVMAYHGADIVFNMTATVSYGVGWRSEAWELLLRARAFENGIFVVGVNKSGDEEGHGKGYYGHSMVITPVDAGKILSRLDTTTEDTLLVQKINLKDIHEARNRVGWMRDLVAQERAWYDGV